MKWLVNTLLGSRREAQIEEPAEVSHESAQLSENTGPRLLLLVPDSVGPYSFQLHTFPETRSAAAFVESAFPPSMNDKLIAFWALHERSGTLPNGEMNKVGETVVLIRDEARTGIVQVFSFVDMESAHSFVRFEAQEGLPLQFVSVYWTLPIAIEVDGEGFVRLTPEIPDLFQRQPEAEKSSEPEQVDALQVDALIEEEAAAAAATTTTTVERQISIEFVMIPSDAEESSPDIPNEESSTDVFSKESLTDISNEESSTDVFSEESLTDISSEESLTGIPNKESLTDISSEESLTGISSEESLTGIPNKESLTDIPSEEIEAPQWPNQNGLDKDSTDTKIEQAELEKQLRGPRRWKVREEPFQGFGSPPGKF